MRRCVRTHKYIVGIISQSKKASKSSTIFKMGGIKRAGVRRLRRKKTKNVKNAQKGGVEGLYYVERNAVCGNLLGNKEGVVFCTVFCF